MLCSFRYGWTSNLSIAILRHSQHENCAKGMTSIIIHPVENIEERFDAYCYDEKGGYKVKKYLQIYFQFPSPFWLTSSFSVTCDSWA